MQWRRIIYYTSYNVDHDDDDEDEGIRTPKYSWWMYNVYIYIYMLTGDVFHRIVVICIWRQ